MALTLANPTHATPDENDTVLLVGYPNAMEGKLAAAVARVLSDEAAVDALAELAAAGDEEGSIAYDPAVELLVSGPAGTAGVGMSGGAVFSTTGVYLGVMVRASTAPGAQIVRVVRQRYILEQLASALAAQTPDARAEVAEFLER